MITRRKAILSATAGLSLAALPARAQTEGPYPNRPIKIIVPAPPGGQSDIMARFVAEGMRQDLGQPIVIDNRGGASGQIGIQHAAKQPADGYTLLCGVAGGMVVNPIFDPRISIDALRDFIPVTQLGLSTNCLFVRSGLPVKTLAEYIAYARGRPGQLTYASIGNGTISHIYTELFNSTAGIKLLHVPFRGGSAAIQELVAGRVDTMIIDFASGDPAMRDGAVRGLGVTGTQRWPLAPEIPTLQEQEVPLTLIGWNGFFVPQGTPQQIVDLLAAKASAVVKDPANRDRLLAFGVIPSGTTSAEYKAIIRSDNEQWRKAVELSGAKPE